MDERNARTEEKQGGKLTFRQIRNAKITERVLNELAATSVNKQYFIEAPRSKSSSIEVKMKVESADSPLKSESAVDCNGSSASVGPAVYNKKKRRVKHRIWCRQLLVEFDGVWWGDRGEFARVSTVSQRVHFIVVAIHSSTRCKE